MKKRRKLNQIVHINFHNTTQANIKIQTSETIALKILNSYGQHVW